MALSPNTAAFRDWLTAEYRNDGRFDRIEVLEAPDPATEVTVRLHVGNRSYYEVRVRPEAGEVQAGFATESRIVNEAVEQAILDAGGDLDDLLGDELCDLGEQALPMKHFFERPAFRFTVSLPLQSPDGLPDAALRSRVAAVLKASHTLFQECVDEA
jgi:hypothetical protein